MEFLILMRSPLQFLQNKNRSTNQIKSDIVSQCTICVIQSTIHGEP